MVTLPRYKLKLPRQKDTFVEGEFLKTYQTGKKHKSLAKKVKKQICILAVISKVCWNSGKNFHQTCAMLSICQDKGEFTNLRKT